VRELCVRFETFSCAIRAVFHGINLDITDIARKIREQTKFNYLVSLVRVAALRHARPSPRTSEARASLRRTGVAPGCVINIDVQSVHRSNLTTQVYRDRFYINVVKRSAEGWIFLKF
jgi:hypothetical protein